MKHLLNLTILLAFAVIVSSQISIDLNAANYQVRDGFWNVNIPVKGGIAPFVYSYQNIQTSWKQQGNAILIPLAIAELGGQWTFRIVITDSLGTRLQRTILLKILSGNIFLGDYAYDQIVNLSTNTIAPGAASTIIRSSSISTQSSSGSSGSSGSSSTAGSSFSSGSSSSSSSGSSGLTTNTFGSPSSTAGTIILPYSGPGSNLPLPSYNQLDGYINTGDIVALTSIIQRVISSSLTCIQKTGYLNDLLGRIESAIFIKESYGVQLRNLIGNSQAQIKSLNERITGLTSSLNGLDIAGLQAQLLTILNNQQQAYDRFNSANVDLTPYNLNITINLQNVNRLTTSLQNTRNQIKADGIALVDTDALIQSLLKQLEAARNNKANLEGRILTQKVQEVNLRTAIDAYNADNVRLNNQIEFINTQRQTLQARFQALEIQASNIKNTITAYQAQRQQYLTQINNLRGQVNVILLNTDQDNLQNLVLLISNLKNSIPTIRGRIDNIGFNCNGAVNYTVSTLDGTITYTFANSAFRTYVTNEYGSANSNAAQAFLGQISNVTLTPITVFSQEWINRFGRPFDRELTIISSDTSTTGLTAVTRTNNQFLTDFSCIATSDLEYATGVVRSITATSITAALKDGTIVNLALGACSNILLLNQSEAKVGNTIFWRGPKVAPNGYQVYTALLV